MEARMKLVVLIGWLLMSWCVTSAQPSIGYIALVDEDTQYFNINPKTMSRELVEVQRKIGLVFSEDVFNELYRLIEKSPHQTSEKTKRLLSDLERRRLLSLLYLEPNQDGRFLMLKTSSLTTEDFFEQSRNFLRSVEVHYGVVLKYGEIPIPPGEKLGLISKLSTSFTNAKAVSIMNLQRQTDSLAVTKVLRP
jgi:hypothetical protein